VTERVLFVHAHPDDETIATGATIATLVGRGAEVAVLTCTRGERGGVIPADLEYLLESPEKLGAYREGELATALAALGVKDHRMLGSATARWEGRAPRRYTDSGMRWEADGTRGPDQGADVESLTAAELGEVAADIAAVLIQLEPDVVVSYDAGGGYGHPDHIRVHDATRTAAEVIGVPFYLIDEGSAIDKGRAKSSLTVDGAAVADRKRAALAAYRTQLTLDADTFSLSTGAPRPIAAAERFSRLRPPDDAFSDHSLTSRISSLVLALVLGAFAGVTLTVAHQATATVAGVAVPWGLIAGVLIMAGLLVGLRLVFETRVVPACAAVGLIGASALLALKSPGGSVLIPGTAAGYIWTFAPVVISIVALGVPWPLQARKPTAPNDKIDSVQAAKGPDLQ
jgi:N-acetyl-1-D-myo-inositol-2-amino-2-deoxy-alpha-D-glucopyranoside deacetylase